MKNHLKLVEFQTKNGLLLPGLLYEPEVKSQKAAIYLHGNGSSSVFYSVERTNILAEGLCKKGIAFFAFNNRGANYITKLHVKTQNGDERVHYGTAYELIKDCLQDINGAIDFLEERGYREFYLLGHSTGANKICVYNFYQPENKIAKYVLLGPGDDTGIYYDLMGKKLFQFALKKAKDEIAKGNGRRLVPKYLLDYHISYQSLYDTINPDGDYNTFPFSEYLNGLKLSTKPLFREYQSIDKPTLVIFGEQDEYAWNRVPEIMDILKQKCSAPKLFEFMIIKETDHSFRGREKELAQGIASWL